MQEKEREQQREQEQTRQGTERKSRAVARARAKAAVAPTDVDIAAEGATPWRKWAGDAVVDGTAPCRLGTERRQHRENESRRKCGD